MDESLPEIQQGDTSRSEMYEQCVNVRVRHLVTPANDFIILSNLYKRTREQGNCRENAEEIYKSIIYKAKREYLIVRFENKQRVVTHSDIIDGCKEA